MMNKVMTRSWIQKNSVKQGFQIKIRNIQSRQHALNVDAAQFLTLVMRKSGKNSVMFQTLGWNVMNVWRNTKLQLKKPALNGIKIAK